MAEKDANQNRRRKTILVFVIFPTIIVVGALAIYLYLQYKKSHISTDDAYVDGRIHTIASKFSGTVRTVYVQDNQFVKAGDLLLDIDPADYEVKLKEAQADLENEQAALVQLIKKVTTVTTQLSQIIASKEASRSNREAQEANLSLADTNFKRAEALLKESVIPQQQYDQAKTTYEVSSLQAKASADQVRQTVASVETQKALIKETEAGIPMQEALIKEKEEALRQAQLNLSYTKIVAPADGYVTKRTVEVGNQIQPAQPLMAVVPLNQEDLWITANYKETDLTDVKPGQKVEIDVDTYPGKVFHGRVDSIMAGTGAVFSLFLPRTPPEIM